MQATGISANRRIVSPYQRAYVERGPPRQAEDREGQILRVIRCKLSMIFAWIAMAGLIYGVSRWTSYVERVFLSSDCTRLK